MFHLLASIVFALAINPSMMQAAAAAPASTQPSVTVVTTQPVNVVQNIDAQHRNPETIAEAFSDTQIGQLFQGKKKVTLQEMRNPNFWIDTIRDLIVAIIGFIPRVIVALLFLLFFWLFYRAVRRVLMGSMGKAAVDPSIRDMLAALIKWTILGFGMVIAFNQIGIQIAALLAGVSIIGLAVGFAAQETLANFIAGIVIFWDKPFKVGDWLELGETYGQVQRVTFRSTRILDLNGQMIIYPNTHMLANRVANHSTHPLTRVAVPIGIAYKENIDAARAAMLDSTKSDDRIADNPPPQVVVAGCGSSSVDLLLRFWIRDEKSERIIVFEYIEKCKKALDAAGISIPFPHMQLFVEETPAIEKLAGGRKAG